MLGRANGRFRVCVCQGCVAGSCFRAAISTDSCQAAADHSGLLTVRAARLQALTALPAQPQWGQTACMAKLASERAIQMCTEACIEQLLQVVHCAQQQRGWLKSTTTHLHHLRTADGGGSRAEFSTVRPASHSHTHQSLLGDGVPFVHQACHAVGRQSLRGRASPGEADRHNPVH